MYRYKAFKIVEFIKGRHGYIKITHLTLTLTIYVCVCMLLTHANKTEVMNVNIIPP